VAGILSAARLHADEFRDLAAAASACTAFCRAWADGAAPPAARLAAVEYAFRDGDDAMARQQASRLLDEYPASGEALRARYVLASCLLRTGHEDAARAELRELAKAGPGTPMASKALLLLGKSYMGRMQNNEARKALEELLAHDAISPEARRAERYLGVLPETGPE